MSLGGSLPKLTKVRWSVCDWGDTAGQGGARDADASTDGGAFRPFVLQEQVMCEGWRPAAAGASGQATWSKP